MRYFLRSDAYGDGACSLRRKKKETVAYCSVQCLLCGLCAPALRLSVQPSLRETAQEKYFLRTGYPVSGISSVMCFCPARGCRFLPKLPYAIIRRKRNLPCRPSGLPQTELHLCTGTAPGVPRCLRVLVAPLAKRAELPALPQTVTVSRAAVAAAVAAHPARFRYLYRPVP